MVRFLADASLHHAIVTGCLRREPQIDFLSAHNAKLHGLSDPDVLEIAATQGRILVTHDFRTMPKHSAEFVSAGGSSPGVFLVQQRTPLALILLYPGAVVVDVGCGTGIPVTRAGGWLQGDRTRQFRQGDRTLSGQLPGRANAPLACLRSCCWSN